MVSLRSASRKKKNATSPATLTTTIELVDKSADNSTPMESKIVSTPPPRPLLHNVNERLEKLCSNYDQFLVSNTEKSDEFKDVTKSMYEYCQDMLKQLDPMFAKRSHSQAMKPLKSLLVKGFDNEQIWQQMEVFNQPLLNHLVSEIAKLSSRRAPLTLNVDMSSMDQKAKNDKKESKSILKTIGENDSSSKIEKQKSKNVKFIQAMKKDEQNENHHPVMNGQNFDKDNFFDLDEMDAFLDAEDRKAMDRGIGKNIANDDDEGENEAIDYFAEFPSDSDDESGDDEDGEPMYSDFFDPPKSSRKLATSIQASGDDSENDDEEEEEDETIDDGDDDDDELDTRDFDSNDEDVSKFYDAEQDQDIVPGMLDAASSSSDDDDADDDDNRKKDNFESVTQKLRSLANENLNSNELDDAGKDGGKSEFERSQSLLRRKIEKAERELLHPANLHWQLAGEIAGETRPENSLLEEHLQFDHISRPAPMITDQTTCTLESIIKQRIKDKAFDDVERKDKPNEQPFEFRRRVMLESEKSKVGLAEVYEQEYVKKQQQQQEQEKTVSSSTSLFAADGEVEESEARSDIRRIMRNLFRKLDALSAFHFTPRPPEPEVKIVSNLPAIVAEEATPDTVSDMRLLAPEEVFNTRNRKVLQAKEERSASDRKRARRLKKKKQSIRAKMSDGISKTREKASAINKMEIEKLKNNKAKSTAGNVVERKAFSSSTKFFVRLQEAKESGKTEKVTQKRKKALDDPNLAKKLKL